MTALELDLSDDDIAALKRWRAIAPGGVNDILTKLKHAVTPTPEPHVYITIALPPETAAWYAANTTTFDDDLGHAGVALNAVTHAARWAKRQ